MVPLEKKKKKKKKKDKNFHPIDKVTMGSFCHFWGVFISLSQCISVSFYRKAYLLLWHCSVDHLLM
jgi:hypothetical protein